MKAWGLVILVTVACGAGAGWAASLIEEDKLREVYGEDLRMGFFVAFLTVAGFLLSLKTFIVVTMKEGLYDSEAYIKRMQRRRAVNPQATHYGTLARLSKLLYLAVLLCLVAAVAQLTFGLRKECWAIYMCIALAGAAVGMLLASLFVSERNLAKMFKRWEDTSLKTHPPHWDKGEDAEEA